jgi:hypothetical protein
MAKRPTDKQYLAAAKAIFQKDGELEFDDKLGTHLVSTGDKDGAYVQCWRFIYDDQVRDRLNWEKSEEERDARKK